jgi:response regulator RpfG family c-di-GMP phosphodiesterase
MIRAKVDTANDDNQIRFASESDVLATREMTMAGTAGWKLLVVDDEEDVHHVTRLVLGRYRFDGRPVQLLGAWSAAEARVVLSAHRDIAVILLDVVMETDDAGLDLVQHVREELGNHEVRIILRTGQPGQAPEHDVVMRYDINDYRAKVELTADKLRTSVTGALRSWRDIRALEQSRRSLQHVLDASGALLQGGRAGDFAGEVLGQMLAIARRGECGGAEGFAARRRQRGFVLVAGTGPWQGRAGTSLDAVLDDDLPSLLERASSERTLVWRGDAGCGRCPAGPNGAGELLFVLRGTAGVPRLERDLLKVYFASVTLAYANASLTREIIDSQREMIRTLGDLVETRSLETAHHVLRVGEMARLLAVHAGVDEDTAAVLRLAAPMHDVGKVGIPDRILNKAGALTPEEFAVMRTHAALGHGILCKSEQRIMRVAARIALQHHERWDGRGYPRRLAGEEISLEGRITAIVDVFDALSSRRVYREARPVEEVLAMMGRERGQQFDPGLLDVFLAHADEFTAVLRDYPDQVAEMPCAGCARA